MLVSFQVKTTHCKCSGHLRGIMIQDLPTDLRKKDVDPNPIKQFEEWFLDIRNELWPREPAGFGGEFVLYEAASLSTAGAD